MRKGYGSRKPQLSYLVLLLLPHRLGSSSKSMKSGGRRTTSRLGADRLHQLIPMRPNERLSLTY